MQQYLVPFWCAHLGVKIGIFTLIMFCSVKDDKWRMPFFIIKSLETSHFFYIYCVVRHRDPTPSSSENRDTCRHRPNTKTQHVKAEGDNSQVQYLNWVNICSVGRISWYAILKRWFACWSFPMPRTSGKRRSALWEFRRFC